MPVCGHECNISTDFTFSALAVSLCGTWARVQRMKICAEPRKSSLPEKFLSVHRPKGTASSQMWWPNWMEIFPKPYSGDLGGVKKSPAKLSVYKVWGLSCSWGAPALLGLVPLWTGKKHGGRDVWSEPTSPGIYLSQKSRYSLAESVAYWGTIFLKRIS